MLFQIARARREHLNREHRKTWARRARLAHNGGDLLGALTGPGPRIIAEVKPASPSCGRLVRDEELLPLVAAYARGGACALSVLAEQAYFQGGGELVSLVRSLTDLPILWKDFVISPSQIFEAKARGASGVLLIARILDPRALAAFIHLANKVGLLPLVEVHTRQELSKLEGIDERFALGINNRSLSTMEVDLDTTYSLLPQAWELNPACVIAESGIRTAGQVEKFMEFGVDGFLIGEALLVAPDPRQKLLELRGEGRCG